MFWMSVFLFIFTCISLTLWNHPFFFYNTLALNILSSYFVKSANFHDINFELYCSDILGCIYDLYCVLTYIVYVYSIWPILCVDLYCVSTYIAYVYCIRLILHIDLYCLWPIWYMTYIICDLYCIWPILYVTYIVYWPILCVWPTLCI